MAYPSTFADLYNNVIAQVRLDSVADLDKTKDWVNQAYFDACVETECLQDYATINLTANVSQYTMDSNIIRMKQLYVTPSGGTQTRPLQPTSIEQILEWSASSGGVNPQNTGNITHYALMGLSFIKFYPTPTSADVVTMYYVKTPTPLSNASDLPVIPEPYATNILEAGASYNACLFLKDPDAQIYQQQYEQGKRLLRGDLARKQGSFTRQFRLTRQQQVRPHDPSSDWTPGA